MSKTYILEPTELEFEQGGASLPVDNAETAYEAIPEGAIIEISGTKLKYAATNHASQKTFTPDGTIPESEPENWASVSFEEGFLLIAYKNAGTFTVSIYTETEDEDPGYTDISHNFAFEDHPRNDLDGIADIMDAVLGLTKSSTPTEHASDNEDIQPGEMTIGGGDA